MGYALYTHVKDMEHTINYSRSLKVKSKVHNNTECIVIGIDDLVTTPRTQVQLAIGLCRSMHSP